MDGLLPALTSNVERRLSGNLTDCFVSKADGQILDISIPVLLTR